MAPVSTWCADADIPEVCRLAATIDRWWDEIAAFIDTGHTNAKSEGVNRVIKLTARNASPPAEPVDTSAPLNYEDPSNAGEYSTWYASAPHRVTLLLRAILAAIQERSSLGSA
ncbi:transposase [Streptomyces erythrochromogenes]|uniref:transposase n=1 Tax=Streptomyces erythrochromogenes TaxID=285574 RepID=UPI0036F9FF5E